ncbi:hypothetical protein LSTR_LSTR012671 [Laodelphax striatellus]|uniref:C2H2-type domain-containing protein n=1 Tax=Laodelphax striatellus TaxID=195883 RepID=A0A482Y077_LAOST|nr:hypothetical protein LSTR_LSTR012671 [Laodelphax striatellus]
MRVEQRREQIAIDKANNDNKHLNTLFCSICKLNHRSVRFDHLSSIRHKKMKRFLMPLCKVCDVVFKSSMLYEKHLCSLEHIKRAGTMEQLLSKLAEKDDSEATTADNKDETFMVLDSVGSGDEAETGEKAEEKEETGEKDEKKKKKEENKLGSQYCKKVDVVYCTLCKTYLPRQGAANKEKAIASHCASRMHVACLLRHKRDQRRQKLLQARRKEIEAEDKGKKIKKEGKNDEEEPKAKKVKVENGDAEEKENWSDENKTSDEEEEEEEEEGGVGKRYDRFKHSAKKLKKGKDEEDDEKDVTLNEEEEEELLKDDDDEVQLA